MKKTFNKSVFWGCSTIIIIVLAIIIGCNKSAPIEEPMPKPNLPLTIHSSELIDIRGTDVFTTNDSLQRKIEIIDRINNTVIDIFYITLKSSDFVENINTQLKNKTFTGTLSITNDNDILFLRNVKNGINTVNDSVNASNQSGNIKSNRVGKCTNAALRACVNSKFEAMNFVELALCVYQLPECYVGVWAICTWDNCLSR